MTKEKVVTLTKYLNELKNKLSSPIPEKHAIRPNEYKEFLTREIKQVSAKLEEEAGSSAGK